MNKVEVLPRDETAGRSRVMRHERRAPPQAVKLLLPVWGYSYVRQFLECGLPTLLAPGNVPALAAALPTEFIILTSVDDEAYIREHAAFRRLAATCEAKIRPIDHLITDSNYSTTITLAYTEAVRAVGDAMLDTCFFFLVSDYIVADASLANALKRMQRGTSAVVVGNFQVAREDGLPWLQDKLASADETLALPPRVLMQWALNHLHPVTLANMVNVPFSHNSHTNRLFWRIDGSTILGRFYLMHMLCIRPEVTDFIIGASCDYSFVPEMCPSGNVEAITDSDEYLVIEMQPGGHEVRFLRPGPLTALELAASLSEWATKVHRENANHLLIFHAGDLPSDIGRGIAKADAFIAEVATRLGKREPIPYRGHPYWRGAMAAFYNATERKLTEDEWRYALGMPPSSDRLSESLLWRAKFAFLGRPPYVPPWHPLWPDFRIALREIDGFFTDQGTRLLTLSNEVTALSLALADSGERVVRARCAPFMQNPGRYEPLHESFDLCLLELHEEELWHSGELLDRIVPLMKHRGRIVLFVRNQRSSRAYKFSGSVALHGERFFRPGIESGEVYFVPASRLRWMGYRGLANLRRIISKEPWIGYPLAVAASGLLIGMSFIGNLFSLRRSRLKMARGIASSFTIRLEVANALKLKAPHVVATVSPLRTRETSHDACIELKRTVGLASLGVVVNQIWYENPTHLAVVLARYKFVAKAISGLRNVGEVGCGDAFCTRIVAQEVADVTAYDPNPLFIEDIRSRRDKRWPLKAVVHNIMQGPLPRKHEALFSLNMTKHVAPADEYVYVANLCASLAEGGLLIIGTPSAGSQLETPLPGTVGHINCKGGKELKKLLGSFFTRVLLVSMCDEVIHAGFHPMADYLFAICTSESRFGFYLMTESKGLDRQGMAFEG
jgi:hypothetical protein